MKQGRTLQELAVELDRQKQAIRDFRVPARLLKLGDTGNPTGLAVSGIATFGTNKLFLNQLTGWAGIPQKYVDKMLAEDPALLAVNVNCWLDHNDHQENRLVRTLDGTARAFLSHRYRTLDNVDVIGAVLPVFQERGITTVSAEVTDAHLYVKGLNDRRTVELGAQRGDKVQFGVVISNSEVGLGAVHVDPLVFTLACLNGAVIAAAGLRKFHIGRHLQELEEAVEVFQDDTVLADNRAFFLKLRDVVNAAFDEAQMTDLLAAIAAGTQRRLGAGRFLDEVVEVATARYGLNQPEAEGVLRALIDGRDLTQWGLANAVTATARAVESYERATELERIGGTIMVLPEGEWRELAA
jgi:hypothetical protein